MKIPYALFACAALAAITPVSASPLGNEMEAIGQAVKGFSKETDPTKAAALVRTAQDATLRSIAMTPKKIAAMPDGQEKSVAQSEYRQAMAELYVKFCEIEQAILSKKTADLPKLMDDLKALKKQGHAEFMKD